MCQPLTTVIQVRGDNLSVQDNSLNETTNTPTRSGLYFSVCRRI